MRHYWNWACYKNLPDMKKLILLQGIAVVLTAFLISSGTSLAGDNEYGNIYIPATYNDDPGKIQIYPNPVTDKILYISSDSYITKVEIMDITGSSVFIQKYEKETRKIVLNLDNLNRGLYIIQVKLDNNSARTEKIMIE
jgi:hypothetical protein